MNDNKLSLTFAIMDIAMIFLDIKMAFDAPNVAVALIFIFFAVLLAFLAASFLDDYFKGGKE